MAAQTVAISGCRSLSQSFGALSLNSSWSETPGLPLETNTFVVLLKLVGAFSPQAQHACAKKNDRQHATELR